MRKPTGDRANARHDRAQAVLDQQGFLSSLLVTQYPGHAQELATTAAAQEIDTVIVIGGDGTVNEVVNGLLTAGQGHVPRLGIIPSGSSNDFSKSLGIPQRLEEACRVIVEGRIAEVDVGRAGSRYFCSASCLGYFAEVAARSLEMKRWRGSLRYVIPALGVIREMTEGWEMTVKADGQVFHGVYAVLLVGNAVALRRAHDAPRRPARRWRPGLFTDRNGRQVGGPAPDPAGLPQGARTAQEGRPVSSHVPVGDAASSQSSL